MSITLRLGKKTILQEAHKAGDVITLQVADKDEKLKNIDVFPDAFFLDFSGNSIKE